MLIDKVIGKVFELFPHEAKIDGNKKVDWLIKVTEQSISDKLVVIFSVNKKKLFIAKFAFDEYSCLHLDNEYTTLNQISETLGFKHIPKTYYYGKEYGAIILIQEYIEGKSLLSLIGKEVDNHKYKRIEEYCISSMGLLLKLHKLNNNKSEPLHDIINPKVLDNRMRKSGKGKVTVNSYLDKLYGLFFTPGIFHGDYCLDNIIIQNNEELSLIDWEFSKINFLKELDALFFCLSFLETVYFRILNFKNKNLYNFIKFLSEENEFTNIAQRSLSFYFKHINISLSQEYMTGFLIILLSILNYPSYRNKFYKDIMEYFITNDFGRSLKWLKLA